MVHLLSEAAYSLLHGHRPAAADSGAEVFDLSGWSGDKENDSWLLYYC